MPPIARVRSDDQLRAASPEASVWVGASAGSGKTSVLSDRVLRLMLLDGAKPERLLCLTFTKAAAAEMKTRVMVELAGWARADDAALADSLHKLLGRNATDDEEECARRLFARALDAPGGLKIQTIHGFCQSLLGRFPLEAGVVPYFDLAEDRVAGELMAEARNRVLAAARVGGDLADALATATERAGEQRFDTLIQDLARERGRLMRLVEDHGIEDVVARIFARHAADPTETPERLIAEAVRDGAFDLVSLRRACDALSRSGVEDQRRAPVLAAFLADPKTRVSAFDSYRGIFLTKEGTIRARLAAKAAEAHDARCKETMQREAERIQALDQKIKALRIARATSALARLAVAVIDTYAELKQAKALLDYDDLILKARDLLSMEGVAPWVLFKLDGGLDHILIDEAQDTNPDQWQVVQHLAEEFFAGFGARPDVTRTIFAVGDYKQSIYGFQRADPREFQRMRLHFAMRAAGAQRIWDEVQLETSFRSTPAVLSSVDAVFEPTEARAGVSPGDAPIHHVPHRKGAGGLVEIWPLEEPAERDPFEAWTPPVEQRVGHDPETNLARLIARRIKGWIGRETLPARGSTIRAGDVMVLVRRRGTFLDALVRALKQEQVPVAGADRILLTEQLAVMDLMALGHALLLPSDDLTFATVLKSPLVGLDEDQLYRLAQGRDGTLWRRLQAMKDAEPAFADAHGFFADLLARVDYLSPFALFAHVLGPLGGRKRIQARLGPESLDALEEFLNAALSHERAHPPSLQGFLHWLDAAAEDIKRDLEHGARDEVRVMTVHGAKGLQAPIVILPDTVSPLRDDAGVLWTDDGLPLWCPRAEDADQVAGRARAAARTRREEEHRRLLYVAMTRAEDRLYVCGWRTSDRKSSGTWYDLIAAAFETLNAEKIPEPPARRVASRQEAKVEAPKAASAAIAAPALPAWAHTRAPDEPKPPRPLAPSRPEDPEPPVRSPLIAEDGLRFRRGQLVHRLLQSLPDLPREARATAARRWLGRPGQGLTKEQEEALLKETLAILDDPALSALFGPGSRAEVPITGVVGAHVVSGQVDRLVALPERILVIDYKTNRPPPTTPERVAPLYLRQMSAYRAVLRKVYAGLPVECRLLWTDGPRQMALPDALLDRFTPA